MSHLERALKWLSLGGRPFPCYEVDTWVGDNLHVRKSPRTARGFYDAFETSDQVREHWSRNPDHLVGIWCGPDIVVLDIDKKVKFNRVTGEEVPVDGQYQLDENDVEIPETFSVMTPSGGEHRFYRNPGVQDVGGDVDLTYTNGVILEGVDRRAGNSYFIAWSDALPDSLDDLAEAPAWLLQPSSAPEQAEYDKDVRSWLSECETGTPDTLVLKAIARIPSEPFDHNKMRDSQYHLIKLGTAGHSGVPEALWELRKAWLRDPWNAPEWIRDWSACLAGGVRKYGRFTKELLDWLEEDDETFEKEVVIELRRKRIQLEAELRLLSSDYQGSELLTLVDLQDYRQDYLVDTLVPRKKGLTALVAKRNIGKTFSYISMVLSMVFGMPWMGKKTERVKVLVVLGEGVNGFYDRIVAWCDYWNKPLSEVEEWLYFLDGANLSNQASLKILKEAVETFDIELCVFDTWAATSGVVDEDKAAVTSIALTRLRDAVGDASVLIVHHPNKSSENSSRPSARGSTALEARADVVMTITEDKKYKSKAGLSKQWIQLSTSHEHGGKNRGAPLETIQGAYVETEGAGAVWLLDDSSLISHGGDIVRQHLRGSMTVAEFSSAARIPESSVRRYFRAALADGIVSQEKSERRNEPARYRLTWSEMLPES